MGYLIIFNAAAAAQFVGLCLHCTGLFQPSNSYYRAIPRDNDVVIAVLRVENLSDNNPR